jgi:hypothetical protein
MEQNKYQQMDTYKSQNRMSKCDKIDEIYSHILLYNRTICRIEFMILAFR